MSNPKEVLFFDPEELSDLQKEIGVPQSASEGTDLDKPIDEAVSMFYLEFRKVIWYTIGLAELVKDSGRSNQISYEVEKKYHYLTRTYFTVHVPSLRLTQEAKKKYQIRWPPNLGHRIIPKGGFYVDGELWQTVTSEWCDTNMQWFEQNGHGFRDLRQRDLGNVPYMQEFSDVLPEYRLTPEQPWFYSRDSTRAFPIFRCSFMSKISHKFEFNLDIMRLIQIKDLETGELLEFGENGPPGGITSEIFVNRLSEIPEPKLWGEYSTNHAKEFECHDRNPKYSIYVDDIVSNSSDNPLSYGSAVPMKLNNSIYPTKALFWMAENLDAKRKHIFSNYTTNELDAFKGWNPIGSVSFKGKKGRKFDDLPSEHFDRKSAKHFPSAPFQNGYNALSFCGEPNSLDVEPGIVLGSNDENITFRLKNTNPLASISDSNSSAKNYFTVHLFQLITKKMVLNREFNKDSN